MKFITLIILVLAVITPGVISGCSSDNSRILNNFSAEPIPDKYNPLVFEKQEYDMVAGASKAFNVLVFNTGVFGSEEISLSLKCLNHSSAPLKSVFLDSTPQSIPVNSTGDFWVVLSLNLSTPPGNYVCLMTASTSPENFVQNSFFLKVLRLKVLR